MNKLAYDNLKLLDDNYNESLFLISDHNILSLIEKDSYDTCSKIQSLEYPIYFTYHHILNIVDYDKDISYKNRMNLLTMIENSLNNLIDYLGDYEETEENITILIDDIYERYDMVKLNQKQYYLERFVYLFDDIVDGFREASRYLYFSPVCYYPLMNVNPCEFFGETDNDNDETDNDETDNDETDNDETDNDNDETDNDDGETDNDDDETDGDDDESENDDDSRDKKLD